jgi:hypothetical protein
LEKGQLGRAVLASEGFHAGVQLTSTHSVSTPADWKQGEDVIIANTINDDDARKRFGSFETKKPYLRTTKAPQVQQV